MEKVAEIKLRTIKPLMKRHQRNSFTIILGILNERGK